MKDTNPNTIDEVTKRDARRFLVTVLLMVIIIVIIVLLASMLRDDLRDARNNVHSRDSRLNNLRSSRNSQ